MSRLIWLAVLILILAGIIYFYINLEKSGVAKITIRNQEFKVVVAETVSQQQRGLSGRKSLADNEGMLFVFSDAKERSFWMKDMNFNIDILWLINDRIVGWEENVARPAPETKDSDLLIYKSPQPVNRVLELSAGSVKRLGLIIGDQIYVQDLTL